MKIDIITIFPEMFKAVLDESIIKRAQEKGLIKINLYNLRDYTDDPHRQVDDMPFGGGPGMVMKPEPFFKAVSTVTGANFKELPKETKVILMSPQGTPFTQELALSLSKEKHLIFLCPRYEGVDERVGKYLADYEISIGDYVLSGGELPAMVVIDAVVRLIPGVLGDEKSTTEESFVDGLLEYPHYTRPRDFMGYRVPKILLSGNHAEIAKWRRRKSLERTFFRRPELLQKASLTEEDRNYLRELKNKKQRGD